MAAVARPSLALAILACLLASQGRVSATRVLAQDLQAAVNSLGAAANTFTKALTSSAGTSGAAAQQQQQQAAAPAPAGTTPATFSGSQQQGASTGGSSQVPKAVLVDLAPGASVGLADQNGYPKLSAAAPGSNVVVAQGPGQSNPDVSFQLGPNDAPVKVTLGRQAALSGGVSNAGGPASDESGLSGSLSLGHYGVSQSNAFESFAANPNGAEIITPFAKLQVPGKALSSLGASSFQQLPAQLVQLAKAFQVQSALAPAPAPQALAAGAVQGAP